jgi:hypothetical protein
MFYHNVIINVDKFCWNYHQNLGRKLVLLKIELEPKLGGAGGGGVLLI